jgi:hypothetical protein
MKKINFFLYLNFGLMTLAGAGCKKETTITPAPPSSHPVNRAPIVNAGPDIRIEIPTTQTILAGTAYDPNGNIKNYNWKKISGPVSYFLERSYNSSSKLFWLEDGEYEFEFTATDKEGLMDKDTVKVTVFSKLKKYLLYNLTPNAAGFSIAQIPSEVKDNLKWVFGKIDGICEQADAGPNSNIDYSWGGYYYELLPGNWISVMGGYTGFTIDIIIYYQKAS